MSLIPADRPQDARHHEHPAPTRLRSTPARSATDAQNRGAEDHSDGHACNSNTNHYHPHFQPTGPTVMDPTPDSPAPPAVTPPMSSFLLPCIDSHALLAGARELLIRHGDELYRLRHTRSDKLILVK